MKNCKDCKFAKWERTASGRLHPSGDGECLYKVTPPVLPACKMLPEYWVRSFMINRHRDFPNHCPTFARV